MLLRRKIATVILSAGLVLAVLTAAGCAEEAVESTVHRDAANTPSLQRTLGQPLLVTTGEECATSTTSETKADSGDRSDLPSNLTAKSAATQDASAQTDPGASDPNAPVHVDESSGGSNSSDEAGHGTPTPLDPIQSPADEEADEKNC